MKKILLWVVSVLVLLTGCSKDPLSQRMIDDIKSIGDVTLDDEDLIIDLENTYAEMTDKQKNQVNNYIDLKDARKELDALKESQEESIAESERIAESESIEQLNELLSTSQYQNAILIVSTLKDSLYNPQSLQIHNIRYYQNDTTLSDSYMIEYSGENRLGGTVTDSVIIVIDISGIVSVYESDDEDYSNRSFKFYTTDAESLDVDLIMSNIN